MLKVRIYLLIIKISIFRKNGFSSTKPLESSKALLTTQPKAFRQNSWEPSLKNKYEKQFFDKKINFLKFSSGNKPCSFDKPAGSFSPKLRRFSSKVVQILIKLSFLQIFSPRSFILTTRKQFWQPCQNWARPKSQIDYKITFLPKTRKD